MKNLILFLTCVFVSVTSISYADWKDNDGIYISVFGGGSINKMELDKSSERAEDEFFTLTFPSAQDLNLYSVRTFDDMEGDVDNGIVFLSSIGLRYGNVLRLEFEFGFRNTNLNSVEGERNSFVKAVCDCESSDLTTDQQEALTAMNIELKEDGVRVRLDEIVDEGIDIYSYMANAYFDLSATKICNITPYFGAGLGLVKTYYNVKVMQTASVGEYPTPNFTFPVLHMGSYESRTMTDVGYQGMAGLSYKYNKNITVVAGYRYFGTPRGLSSHGFESGLRYNF